MSRIRRSKVEIIVSILYAAMESVNATRIAYRANLSYGQVKSYLKLLIENDLIDVDSIGENKLYSTAPKGKLLLKHWSKIKDLLFA